MKNIRSLITLAVLAWWRSAQRAAHRRLTAGSISWEAPAVIIVAGISLATTLILEGALSAGTASIIAAAIWRGD